MPTATITLFLTQGDPKRLRTAEISNWTGKAVSGPRSEFEGVVSRDESGHPGVYLLTGTDLESGRPAIYVGEAESIKERVRAHLERDFWNQIVFFISKDENLTKAHIKYLEGRLIDAARKAGRSVVTNGQSSGAKLPESAREDMEIFLEKIHQLLPVLGIDLLVPSAGVPESVVEREILFCDIKGLRARGRLIPDGFLVLKGSQAVLNDRASTQKWPWASNIRQKLKAEGLLVTDRDHLVFTANAEFASPSAAAAAIHGGHANGLISWKNESGKTLKQIESP